MHGDSKMGEMLVRAGFVREMKTFENHVWQIGVDDIMPEITRLSEARCSKTAVGY